MKKKAILFLLAALCFGNNMTALAAPEMMSDGEIFDAAYYAEQNPDVTAEVGNDKNLLYQHYVSFGKAEGRKPYQDTGTDTVAIQNETAYLQCLTNGLPMFPAEVTAKNNLTVPVHMEPLDGHYLMYTNVVTRTYFGTDGSRKDYSNDPIYLAARDYIVEWLNNKDNEKGREIDIPITFICHDKDEFDYFYNMVDNLEIDLHKSGVCKNRSLYMGLTSEDGKSYVTSPYGYKMVFFCDVDNGLSPEELFNEQSKDEIPINPTTGLPAQVGDSWDIGNGVKYIIL